MNTRRGGGDSSVAGEHCAFYLCIFRPWKISVWMTEGKEHQGAVSHQDKHAVWGRERIPLLHEGKAQTDATPASSLLWKGQFLERGACMLEIRYAKWTCGLARAERFQPAERPLFCWANLAGFLAIVADHSELSGLSHTASPRLPQLREKPILSGQHGHGSGTALLSLMTHYLSRAALLQVFCF